MLQFFPLHFGFQQKCAVVRAQILRFDPELWREAAMRTTTDELGLCEVPSEDVGTRILSALSPADPTQSGA